MRRLLRILAELAYERPNLDVEIERIGDEIRIRPARFAVDFVSVRGARPRVGRPRAHWTACRR